MSDSTYYQDEILKNLKLQTTALNNISRQLADLLQRQRGSDAYQWTAEGLPICPRHGEVMQRREKQGDIWYSHRVIDPDTGEECWCKGRPGKDSPGWDVGNQEPAQPGPAAPPATPNPKPETPNPQPETPDLVAQARQVQDAPGFWGLATTIIQARKDAHEIISRIANDAGTSWQEKALALVAA